MKESATRNRILEVASRLFYMQGYNSTGINQIIDEAKIARGSLYNHFPSKRDLLTAYIDAMEISSLAEWDNALDAIKNPKKKILAIYDICIARQVRSNFAGCPFIKVGAEIPCEDASAFVSIANQKKAEKTYIETLLTNAYPDESQIVNKEMLASTLFLLMEGAMVTSSIEKDLQSLKDAKKIADSLLHQSPK